MTVRIGNLNKTAQNVPKVVEDRILFHWHCVTNIWECSVSVKPQIKAEKDS